MLSAICFNLDQSKILFSGKGLTEDRFSDLYISKINAVDKLDYDEKMKFIFEGVERLWKKEKKLVTSIFSISLNVFKRLLFQVC